MKFNFYLKNKYNPHFIVIKLNSNKTLLFKLSTHLLINIFLLFIHQSYLVFVHLYQLFVLKN